MRGPWSHVAVVLVTGAGVLAMPAATWAQDAVASDGQGYQQLLDRINQVEAENRAMREEINELRASDSEQWMTERRAEEIRSLVSDVLADADTRASFQDGLTAGWNEHFYLASPDGRFKLSLGGQLQIRWLHRYQDTPDRYRQGFETTRTELTFAGHVFNEDITYMVRTDATRNETGLVNGLFFIKDAWVRYRFNNNWSMRVGQMRVPFNREELVSAKYQLAVERSLVNESFNLGRSQGVELAFTSRTNKWTMMISDGADDNLGGFNSVGSGQTPTVVDSAALLEDVEWAVSMRWEHLVAGEWQQFQDFTSPPGEEFGLMVGIAAHGQQEENTGSFSSSRQEIRWLAATMDVSAEWGGASAFGSFGFNYVDNPGFGIIYIYGWVLQGAFYLSPKTEIFARYEHGFWEAGFEIEDLNAMTVGLNYYLDGHDVKWTTDLGFGIGPIGNGWQSDIAGYAIDGPGAEPQIVFRTQLQLLF